MKGEIFAITVFFVFLVFLFPTIYEQTTNINSTLTLAPVIKSIPYLILVISALVLLYGVWRRKWS